MYPTTCDTAYFGGYRQHHVHMIQHQMPFFDPAFFLPRQFTKHFSQVLPQLLIQRPATTLRNKYNVVFALPLRMT